MNHHPPPATSEIAAFEEARNLFVDGMKSVPTAALAYLSPGDDYALGGLVTHINAILRRYGRVLDAIIAAPTVDVDAQSIDAEMDLENAGAMDGLTADNRDAAMATLNELHEHVATAFATLGADAWMRKTPVIFGGSGGQPYPTSAADIAGWLTGHYIEHVPHVTELLEGWRLAGGE